MTTRNPVYRGVKYRAFPTCRDYSFTFAWVVETRTWRAYIDNAPDYRGRPSDAHSSHRLQDEHGSYICWDSQLSTLSQCQAVAALWADCTENYIRHGTFVPPPRRPDVTDRSALAGLGPVSSGPRSGGSSGTRPSSAAYPASLGQPSRPVDGMAQRLLDRARRALS